MAFQELSLALRAPGPLDSWRASRNHGPQMLILAAVLYEKVAAWRFCITRTAAFRFRAPIRPRRDARSVNNPPRHSA